MDGIDPTEWKRLLAAAEAGELYLDPETGKGLDKVCDTHIENLQKSLRTVGLVETITGFGSFDSSKILEKKYSSLATGHDGAMDAILQQHIETVKTMKETVAKAIANYVALDEEQRQQIEKMTP
ncbi:hypothetical protein [Nocardia macrotermitis]|uniref:Uncharacterized protein n=1 Tax=Nocardia macrotermitis TaxID=2585198 RepID=A0A7K0D5C2_9NOCA|nr:hypothetical protein [Nocardia macrotermitis]MQY20512.1 hypothetical protein [Nocardia macrotermitis]